MKCYPTSLSNNLMRRIICFITNLGHSCDSLAINIDTDFGPLRSLLLYSLLLSSLKVQISPNLERSQCTVPTLISHPPAGGSRIVLTKSAGTRPWVPRGAQSRKDSVL